MKPFDTVRIKKTDMVGTVTEIKGHHILVKFDTLSLPAMVFYADELELMESDTVSQWQELCGGAKR